MDYKQIEKARETRLWIGQVVVPAVVGLVVLCSNPNVRYFLRNVSSDIAYKIKNFRRKGKDEFFQ